VTLPPEMLMVTRDDQLSGQCEYVRYAVQVNPKPKLPSPVDELIQGKTGRATLLLPP
jgi:hypothetical protein